MEGCQKAARVQAEPSRCAHGPLTAWGRKKPTRLSQGAGGQISSAAIEDGAYGGVEGWVWGVQGYALGPGESKALSS